MSQPHPGAPRKALLILAVILAGGLAIAVAIIGLVNGFSRDDAAVHKPLPLVSLPAPEAETAACTTLLNALPTSLTSQGATIQRRQLAEPAPKATAAWGGNDLGNEPIVLRCGLDKPPELTPTASLRVIDGVLWLPVSTEHNTTWYAVDREVVIALTIPNNAGTGPIQEISTIIDKNLAPQPGPY